MTKGRTTRRRRDRLLAVALAALALLAAACGGSGAEADDGGQITAATYIPPAYTDLYGGFEIFMKEATSASDGQVTFDWYDSGTLLEADQLVPGLVQGVADVIFTTSSYISSTYPILGVYELPFQLDTYPEQRRAMAYDSELRTFLNDELRKRNLVSLGTMPTTFQWIWTVDQPVTEPADLKGLRIRVAGALEGRTLKALGASPVTMASAEVYEALERGTIDGVLSYIGTIPGRSLQEVLAYGTAAPFGDYSVDAYARADWFEALPRASRDALLEAGRAYSEKGTDAMVKVHEGEYLDTIRSAGVEITELDQQQRAAFEQVVAPTYDEWRDEVGDDAAADKALDLLNR
jgi:TRAP-type C4-dicarboxylate transport system substrate-binding protein